MLSYKESIKRLKPICFLTFDGDTLYNKGNGELIHPHITDESNNNNNGILQTNSDFRKSYLMGQPSLITNDNTSESSSFMFAPYKHDVSGLSDYVFEKSLIEVLHNTTTELPENFTVMFNFNKDSESEFESLRYDSNSNSYIRGNTHTFSRTIFKKGMQIGVTMNWVLYNYNYITISFPGYVVDIRLDDISKSSNGFYNKNWHFTMSHEVVVVSPGLYKNVRKVYFNGHVVHENSSDVLTIPYSASNTAPIEIGGNRDDFNSYTLNDRQTAPLTIDQFAIFDKCLSNSEINELYKKTISYEKMVINNNPSLYVKFDDIQGLTAISHKSDIVTCFYSNESPYIKRDVVINRNRLGVGVSGCVFNGATAKVHRKNFSIIDISKDFTCEFWLSFTNTDRGVVISSQSDTSPFSGLLVEVNRRYNVDDIGTIQVRMGENLHLPSIKSKGNNKETNLNDGVHRHYAIVKKNDTLCLFINGTMNNSILLPKLNHINTHNIYFMGIAPSNMLTYGLMGHFALYDFALDKAQIQIRAFFRTKMLIKGNVSLQGTPHKAQIRVYDNTSGVLIGQYESDSNGDYIINVHTNMYVHLIFLDVHDETVQPRIVGPVLANEYLE